VSRTTERRPVFLTPEQWSDVERLADVLGENRSAWIRRAVADAIDRDVEALRGSAEHESFMRRSR
jgi:hypothetical protein